MAYDLIPKPNIAKPDNDLPMLSKKIYLGLILFFSVFMTSTFFIHSAFGAVSEGCGLWDVNPECDLSGWMKLFLGDVAIGAVLAILLHFFAHRSNVKLEKNTKLLQENSLAIQKILDAQEYSRNRRRDYFVQSTKSSFNAILLRLGLMNRIVLNEKNLDTDDQYHRLEFEEKIIIEIIEKVRQTISLTVAILDPMLVTQIDNLSTYIEQLSPSANKEKLEFSEYDDVKEKIMHLRDRLEEFVTTKKVLK